MEENKRLKDLLRQLKEKNEKYRNKDFIQRKVEELELEWEECIAKPMGNYMQKFADLHQVRIMSYIIFCLGQEDYTKQDIKELLLSSMKDNPELRSVVYATLGDLEEESRRSKK